jgi:hypothetical protein
MRADLGQDFASDTMTPDELAALASEAFGPRWQTALAKAIGRGRVTVNRWAQGHQSIDSATALAIRSACREAIEAKADK